MEAGKARSFSVGANAFSPITLPAKYVSDTVVSSPSQNSDDSTPKRTLTVEYIVEQTFRTIAQMVIQARVKQIGEEGLYTDENGQWLNLQLDYSWQIDTELKKTIPPKKLKFVDGTVLDLIIDIYADFTKKSKDKGNLPTVHTKPKQPPQVLLERWTLQFTSGTNADLKNIPTSINNKWTIVLVRSMCSLLRLLPANNLVRLCKKQPATFDIQFSLFSSPSPSPSASPHPSPNTAPTSPRSQLPSSSSSSSSSGSRRFDEELKKKPAPPTEKRTATTLFSFGSVKSKTGTLTATVEYLNDLSQFEFKPLTIEPFVITDYIPPASPEPKHHQETPKTVQRRQRTNSEPAKPSPLSLQIEEYKKQQQTAKPRPATLEEPPPPKLQPQPLHPQQQQRLEVRPQRKGSLPNPAISPPLPISPMLGITNTKNISTSPIPIQPKASSLSSSRDKDNLSTSFPDTVEELLFSPKDLKGFASPPFNKPSPFSSTPPAFSSTPPPFHPPSTFSSTPPFSSGSYGMYGSHYAEKELPFTGLLESTELRNSKGKGSLSQHSPFKEPTLQDVQLKSRSFHEEGPLIATYAPVAASLPVDTEYDLQLDGGAFATNSAEEDQIGEFMNMCAQPQPLRVFSRTKPLVRMEKLEGYHQFVNQVQQEIHSLLQNNERKQPYPTDIKMDASLLFGEGFLLEGAPFPFDDGDDMMGL